MSILLTADHPVVREGLKAVVSAAAAGFEVVGEAADGPAVLALAAALDPDVVGVDVTMPGMTGAEAKAKLREAKPGRKVVALTVHEDRGYLRLMLEAGAAGYVLKRSAAADLVRAVRCVVDGETDLDPGVAGQVVAGLTAARVALSDREAEVLQLVARGFPVKHITARLGIDGRAVETYKARELGKPGLATRVDVVRYAAGRGWLTGG